MINKLKDWFNSLPLPDKVGLSISMLSLLVSMYTVGVLYFKWPI